MKSTDDSEFDDSDGSELPSCAAYEPHPDPWNAFMEGERSLELAEFPSALLLRIANVVHQEGSTVYARAHGLTLPEWRLLGRLYESAPIRLSSLCRISYIDKGQVSRVLQALSERGLVTLRTDSNHKNRRIVHITAKGRRLAEQIFPEANEAQRKLLNALTEEERRVTYRAICKLMAAFGKKLPAVTRQHEVGAE